MYVCMYVCMYACIYVCIFVKYIMCKDQGLKDEKNPLSLTKLL